MVFGIITKSHDHDTIIGNDSDSTTIIDHEEKMEVLDMNDKIVKFKNDCDDEGFKEHIVCIIPFFQDFILHASFGYQKV
jgi:hypothetical protein